MDLSQYIVTLIRGCILFKYTFSKVQEKVSRKMLEDFLKKLPDKHKGKTSDFRGVFRARSNIYNGDFLRK